MEKVKVSVIIPVYNVEKYIEECLQSVITQTYKNIEIICVDDCGNDNSVNIIKTYIEKDDRIKLVSQTQNKGLGPARNLGLEHAIGDYIFFLDSDDYLKEDIIEKLVQKAFETHSDMITSKAIAFEDAPTKEIKKRTSEMNKWLENLEITNYQVNIGNFYETISTFNCISWGRLYSKKFLIENNIKFIDGKNIHEDNGFFIKFCSCFPNITFTNYVGVLYRIRENAITSEINTKKNKQKKFYNMNAVLKDAINFINNNVDEKYRKSLYNQINNSFLNSYLHKFLSTPFYNFCWKNNDKMLKVCGVTLFREKQDKKVHNRNIIKLLGIPIKKRKISQKFKFVDFDIKSINKPKNYTETTYTTNNNNQELYETLKELKQFKFLPNKGNLGDVLISASEFQYFNAKNLDYSVFNILKKNETDKIFKLVYGGGGLWTNLYSKSYQGIIKIFTNKNLEKCVILPSSFYNCKDLMECLDERFTVFCRDSKSYNYCIENNKKAKFIQANDMVIDSDLNNLCTKNTSFINQQNMLNKHFKKLDLFNAYLFYLDILTKAKSSVAKSDKKIGYFIRQDRENVTKINNENNIDISFFGNSFACDIGLTYLFAKVFIATINSFNTIITDRLHVAITATKLGKQVLIIDNSYGKLSEVYKYSLNKYTNVKLINEKDLSEELKTIVPSKLQNKISLNDLPSDIEDFIIEYGSYINEFGIERRYW